MEVNEIFKSLSERMIKGVMVHTEFIDYFDFLNLHGYKRMSEYHACCEMKGLKKLHTYYLNHYNRLIPQSQFDAGLVIPESWYQYSRQDVDINTKRSAVRDGFTKWRDWERETKTLYSQMFKELNDQGEVASAMKVSDYLDAVDKELKWVERKLLELQSIDYSMEFILDEQSYYHEFFKKKMNEKD